MAEKTKTVGFRLGSDILERAENLATREGVTIHELGKRALIDRIEGEASLHRLGMTVKNLEGEVQDLRLDVSAVFKSMLVLVGKIPPEKAQEVLDQAMGKKGKR
mgnify:CR=1 FL=1